MAVEDFYVGFQPVASGYPGTVVLNQSERESITRIQQNTREAINDVRDDVDDALMRLSTRMADDPDAKTGYGAPWGVWGADVQVSNADPEDVVVLAGQITPSVTPVKATLSLGSADDQVDFECRVPGNGSSALPRGNGILVFYDNNDLVNQAFSVESGVIELAGRRYLAIVVHLEMAAGIVVTVANDIVAACDPTNVAYDAAIGQYLSAVAPGTGADILVATTEGQQMTGGVGGLYEAWLNGDLAIVTDWDIVAETVELQVDGTAHAVGSTVTFVVVANGMGSSLQTLVAA